MAAGAGESYVFADQLAPFFAAQDVRLRRQLCDAEAGAALQADLQAWTKKVGLPPLFCDFQ